MQNSQEIPNLEENKKNLIKEIEYFGVQHEKTKKSLDDIEERASKIKDNKAEFDKTEELKDKAIVELKRVESEVAEIKNLLKSLKDNQDKKTYDLETAYKEKNIKLNNEIEKYVKASLTLKTDIALLEDNRKLLEKEKASIADSILIEEDKLKKLKEISAKFPDIDREVSAKEATKQSLNSDILNLDNKKTVLQKETEKEEAEKENLKKLNSEQEIKFSLFKKTSDNIIKDFETGMDEKIKRLQEKEGNISERESILNEKAETLRKTKSELEKFYNRKLNNIII